MVIILHYALRLSFYFALHLSLSLYYFLGCIGFYCLCCRFFENKQLSFAAYLLLLFSSLGTTIFIGPVMILIFVPMMWFFYFLTAFLQSFERKYFIGCTFTVMLMMITYFPFYFIIINFIITLFFMLFYAGQLKTYWRGGISFIKHHKLCVLLAVLAITLSLIPHTLYYLAAQNGEFIYAPSRHGGAPDAHPNSLHIQGIHFASIWGQMGIKELFYDLSHLSSEDRDFFYVPIFIYIILLLSIINPGNRRLSVLFFSGLMITLIASTMLTPLYPFLYKHVYIFRLFRIMYFFMYFLMPIFILFGMEQFRLFLESSLQRKRPVLILSFTLMAHMVFASFLIKVENFMPSVYAVIIGSALFFSIVILNKQRLFNPLLGGGLLTLIILAQPIELYSHYTKNSSESAFTIQDDFSSSPKFTFRRPLKGEDFFMKLRHKIKKVMLDSSGFVNDISFHPMGTQWAYDLHEKITPALLENYVRHKFIVYDAVEFIDDEKEIAERLEGTLTHHLNLALIAGKPQSTVNDFLLGKERKNNTPLFIEENSDDFKILDFDVNEIKIKTQFKSNKFLVYNDSFHKDWRVSINTRASELYRTNMAFKGVFLSAGENIIHFKYGNKIHHSTSILLFALFIGYLIYLLSCFMSPHSVALRKKLFK